MRSTIPSAEPDTALRLAALLIATAIATAGCGDDPAPPSIEPEPTERTEGPPIEESPRSSDDEAATVDEVTAALRDELRTAGFAPTVPLGFASEAEDGPTYDRIAAILAASPRVTRVRIDVHSNPRGSAEYNRQITLERARAAAAALVARGVACERLEPMGFGEDRPLPDAPMDAQSRVVLSILRVDDVEVSEPDVVEGPDACPG